MKQIVSTRNAPTAIGPYSQGVVANGLVFASGQIAMDPETGEVIEGGIVAQTKRVLENLRNVLEAGGSSMDAVVKTTVYLADMGDFVAMNDVYAAFFPENSPARATVQVAALPKGVAVEIDAIAVVG